MRRTAWIALFAVPCILLAGDIAYWQIASERLRDGMQDWVAAGRARGWDIQTGAVTSGGWPQAATLAISGLHARHSGADIPGAVDWTSAGITLSVSLYLPTDLHVSLTGAQRISLAGLPDTTVTGDSISATVPLQGTQRWFDFHSTGLSVVPANSSLPTTIGLLNARVALAGGMDGETAQSATTFMLSAEAVALPASIKWPLGPNISSVSLEGSLNGPLPADQHVTTWAQAWRDGGGSLEITHMSVGWGPLGLTSSATVALDDQLQPMGSGSGRIVGYAQTLDRLAAAGALTKSAATAAKAVLSLMAGTADGDEPSMVDVPLTLQYRTLSMRQVPLVRFPELDWPAR